MPRSAFVRQIMPMALGLTFGLAISYFGRGWLDTIATAVVDLVFWMFEARIT
ncbi:MAG: hypothetical protein ACREEJ_16735 [Ensifer adhaerens]